MFKKVLNYIIYIFLCIVFFDVFIFRLFFQFGIPFHDVGTSDIPRRPVPYMNFIAKGNFPKEMKSYDEISLYNKENDNKELRVAFFGGSTGEQLSAKYFSQILSDKMKTKVNVKNFSCSSANHRQHMHMILELLPKYNPDIIVFYGGVNEGTQYLMEDPRPGYPYNTYLKMDTSPLKQVLIEYSAIFSSLEGKYKNISAYNEISKKYKDKDKHLEEIKDKYFETIYLSKNVAETLNSNAYGKTKFIAFYQPYRVERFPEFVKTHNEIREKIKEIPYIFDIHDAYDKFDKSIWIDYCHVKSDSGADEHILDVMSQIIAEQFPVKKKKEQKALPPQVI